MINRHKAESRNYIYICLFLVILCYSNTLSHQFVWDDDEIILTGRITDFFSAFKSIFSANYFLFSKEQSFRPITTLSYLNDAFFWNMNPLGYHLTNLMFHLLAVILVFYLAKNLGLSNQGAFVTASIFAIHPIQTESVNAVSFREELLVAFLYLSAFLFLARRSIFAGSICYLFALLAKEMALSFPLVFLLYQWGYPVTNRSPEPTAAPLVRTSKGALYIAFVTGVYLILRFIIFPGPVRQLVYPAGSFYKNILTTGPILIHYLRLFFFPLGLKAEYSVTYYTSLFEGNVIIAIVLFILMGFYLIKIRKRDKIVLFSCLWIGLTILPVGNFFPIPEMIAERYLYLPLIGFALFAGRVFEYILLKHKLIAMISIISLITFFSFLTYSRNDIWKDDITLWENSKNEAPLSPRLHHNLGNAYLKSGQINMARVEYRVAIDLNPYHNRAHNNLGVAYALSNKPDLARIFWQKALKLNPDSESAAFNLRKRLGN